MKRLIIGLLVVLVASGELAAAVIVDARSNIFEAGDPVAERGFLPVEIAVTSGTAYQITSTGWTRAAAPWPVVGPDGGTQGPLSWQQGTNIFSADGISGIKHNRFLFLTGAFLGDDSPVPGDEPSRLDFTVIGSDFLGLSPLLAQSFFIGDGLTGVGSGTTQRFHAPVGATRLFLGFADAGSFGWPDGREPGAYLDNTGSLTVSLNPVPEPSTLAVWSLLGLIGIGYGWRRRK